MPLQRPLGVKGFRDISIPLKLGPRGFFALSDEPESIEENLRAIIFTDVGERIMRPDIGVPLREMLFEPIDDVFRSVVRTFILSQITQFESRVQVLEISVAREEEEIGDTIIDRVAITIFWRHKATSLLENTDLRAEFRRRAA